MTKTAATREATYQGLPAIELTLPDGSAAVVLLHGAHVLSWQAAGWGEQLYLSPKAVAAEGKAVRGGIPVIFPQFEQRGPDRSLPRHGLARTRAWTLDSHRAGRDHALASFTLSDTPETRALWPHAFLLEYTVSLGPNRLDLELHVHNPGDTAWPFSAALHTYLAASDLGQLRLQGLEGRRFIDAVTNGEYVEDHPEKRFAGEIDRIYEHVPRSLLLRDGPRRLTIEAETFEDAVLWNPGPDKCAALSDMPADDWRQMLCVEAAQILNPPMLKPGESWTARQSLVLPD
jgi:glucose-6-phosphate 1-epimerase